MSKITHPNEVRITDENIQQFMDEAANISNRHVEALVEQIKRQSEK
jgi:hypothetical protein